MLEAVLKGLEGVVIPDGVLLFEDLKRCFAIFVSLEVRLRGMVCDELFTELRHRKRTAILEASNKLAIESEEQIHAFLLEVVFGELIHCTKYSGTFIRGQRFSFWIRLSV